jgi:hypothetical protein
MADSTCRLAVSSDLPSLVELRILMQTEVNGPAPDGEAYARKVN